MIKYILLGFVVIIAFFTVKSVNAEWAISLAQEDGGRVTYGTAWNYNDRQQAVDKSFANCDESSTNECIVIAQGANGCASLATAGGGNNSWGYAQRDRDEDARTAAVFECQKRSSTNCYVRSVFCDTTKNFKTKPASGLPVLPVVPLEPLHPGLETGIPGGCRSIVDYNACISPRQGHGEAYCRRIFC